MVPLWKERKFIKPKTQKTKNAKTQKNNKTFKHSEKVKKKTDNMYTK